MTDVEKNRMYNSDRSGRGNMGAVISDQARSNREKALRGVRSGVTTRRLSAQEQRNEQMKIIGHLIDHDDGPSRDRFNMARSTSNDIGELVFLDSLGRHHSRNTCHVGVAPGANVIGYLLLGIIFGTAAGILAILSGMSVLASLGVYCAVGSVVSVLFPILRSLRD